MVTFTINIPPMLAYIPAPWILWGMPRKEWPSTSAEEKDKTDKTNPQVVTSYSERASMLMLYASWPPVA